MLGRSRPKNGLDRFRPKYYCPLLGQTRPRRLGWARTSLAQQQTLAGGIIFPPPFCMQNVIRSACRNEKKRKCSNEGRRKNYLARRRRWSLLRFRRCCGVAVEAGGGIKRRYSPNGSSKQCCYLPRQRRSSRLLAVFFVFYVPSRFLALLPLSVGFSVSLSSVSVDFLSSSLSSVFFFLPGLLPFSSLSSVFLGLFIEPRGGAFYGCTWGAGAAAVGRPFGCSCRDVTPLFSAWRAAGGRPAGVAGEVRLPRFSGKACGQERDSTLEEEKPTILLSSPAARPWEEERGTVSFKTTPFRSSLFFSFFFFLFLA